MTITGRYAASNFFFTQGISVDLENRCFRRLFRYLSFIKKRTRCMPLPKTSYVLLFRTLYAKCEACSVSDFDNSGLVQLSLVYGRNRRLILNESDNKKLLFDQAMTLAQRLGVKVRDSATDRRNPRWMNVPKPHPDQRPNP